MAPPYASVSTKESENPFSDDASSPLTYRSHAQSFLTEGERQAKGADNFFVGPADSTKHSKLPFWIRIHGSVLPQMIIPILFVGLWTTCIYFINKKTSVKLRFDSQMLTVTGILVGLALSFRSTTGYERYIEGRRYWAQLTNTSQNFARTIWVHAKQRKDDHSKEDLLAKITCLQLLVTFAVALKHRLRFEPYVEYEDMSDYVGYLNTWAKEANEGVSTAPRKYSVFKRFGMFLGIDAAESDPRKAINRATKPLGNLPLEVLSHLQAYLDEVVENGTLKSPVFANPVIAALGTMNDCLTNCDRILNTPLPLAYRIVISQITWAYVLTLPFQLYDKLGWKMVPAIILAAYIILGMALIGAHIENPFGYDANDLQLDLFCEQIATEIDIISSTPPEGTEFMKRGLNKPLYPLSRCGPEFWLERSEQQIQEALTSKVKLRFDRRKNIPFEYDEKVGMKMV